MFRRNDEALALVLFALEFVELALRVLEAFLEFLDLGAVVFLGLGLHLADDGEGAVQGGAAAGADQIAVAGELLNEVLQQREIAIEGHDDALAEHFLNPHADLVEQHVGVGDEDHGGVAGFLQ